MLFVKMEPLQHMLNDYLRAWHAGTGKWGNVTDINGVILVLNWIIMALNLLPKHR